MEDFNNMNNFNNDQQNMKEKNMYLLHLDGARILILSAILIGIIAITFLIGVNFTEKKESKEDLFTAKSENIFDKKNSNDKKSIDELFKNSEAEQGEKNLALNEKNPDLKNEMIKTDSIKKDPIMTEDVKEIIPANKPIAKKNIVKSSNSSKKRIAKRKKNNNKIKPVSASIPGRKKTIRVENNISKKGYSIQVAAYDRKFKAIKEKNILKASNYESYTDKASVKGRNYFRVLIGPLASKRKALNLLKKIQGNPRYEESYVIFQ